MIQAGRGRVALLADIPVNYDLYVVDPLERQGAGAGHGFRGGAAARGDAGGGLRARRGDDVQDPPTEGLRGGSRSKFIIPHLQNQDLTPAPMKTSK